MANELKRTTVVLKQEDKELYDYLESNSTSRGRSDLIKRLAMIGLVIDKSDLGETIIKLHQKGLSIESILNALIGSFNAIKSQGDADKTITSAAPPETAAKKAETVVDATPSRSAPKIDTSQFSDII